MNEIIRMKRVRMRLELEKQDEVQGYDGHLLGFDFDPRNLENVEAAFDEMLKQAKEKFKEMIKNDYGKRS